MVRGAGHFVHGRDEDGILESTPTPRGPYRGVTTAGNAREVAFRGSEMKPGSAGGGMNGVGDYAMGVKRYRARTRRRGGQGEGMWYP